MIRVAACSIEAFSKSALPKLRRSDASNWLRYAGTVTYGRALMGRASRENISCRGLRWDIFPLRSDYGGTSMAWVGLLAWAIYMALTPPSMAWRGPRSVGEIQSSRMIKIREFFHAV